MASAGSAEASPPSPAAHAPRLKPLRVKIYGVERDLGLLPPPLHTDARALLLGLERAASGKGRPVELSEARTAAVDAALRKHGAYAGVGALGAQLVRWRAELRGQVDAASINAYYDEWRAEGYTRRLAPAQEALTLRCAEVGGVPLGRPALLLDVGCGSGLSSEPLVRRGCAALGLDASFEMLRAARRAGVEVVQADMAQPFPLRGGVFDRVVSVSAIQFLCHPTEAQSAEARMASAFAETRRVLRPARAPAANPTADGAERPTAAFQFHPDTPSDALRLQSAASACGFATALLIDQPHHTTARRWFLYACPTSAQRDAPHGGEHSRKSARLAAPREATVAPPPAACCSLHAPLRGTCVIALQEWAATHGLPVPTISSDHLHWMKNEHARHARRLLRLLRRQEMMATECHPTTLAASGGTLPPERCLNTSEFTNASEEAEARALRDRLSLEAGDVPAMEKLLDNASMAQVLSVMHRAE
ncbi:hypothetical protein AB1Y20_006880 [Prymnesium parvum]|uniref:Methyltransferase type 11 domain-containing protein n=1 Tax=Prymnesium parvum TaxID=97485 RepID=A0AB34IZP3_PRYPA